MTAIYLFVDYFIWHYSRSLLDALRIWGNAFWFTWNYFSMKQMFLTLLTPWHRLGIRAHEGIDVGFFGALLITTLMRIIGLIMRVFVIVLGLVALALVAVLGAAAFVLWLILPILVGVLIYGGVRRLAGI